MIINFKISRTINVSKNVALWNTWDHEHLTFVHQQFGKSVILYEDSNVVFIKTRVQIPYTPFFMNTIHTLTRLKNDNVLVIDSVPFGIITKLKMEYIELGKSKTLLNNYYELHLPFIFYPFKAILIKLIKKWNNVNWLEDLPLKTRRQQALDMGFRDFYGNNPSSKDHLYKVKLPLPRLKDSILNEK